MRPALIDAAQQSDVLTSGNEIWNSFERGVQTHVDDFESLQYLWILGKPRRDDRHTQRGFGCLTIEVRTVSLAIHLRLFAHPLLQTQKRRLRQIAGRQERF